MRIILPIQLTIRIKPQKSDWKRLAIFQRITMDWTNTRLIKSQIHQHFISVSGCFFRYQPILQLSSPNQVSTSSIQFWDYLLDIRSHKSEGSVPQVYPHLRCQSQDLGHLYFLPTGYKSGVTKSPSSGLTICSNNSQN